MGERKKIKSEPQNENIKVKHSYFEQLFVTRSDGSQVPSRNLQSLMDKKVFPSEFRPNYWLGKVFQHLISRAKEYFKDKQDLILSHTKKHEEDGKDPKSGKEWKKGDPIILPNGAPDWIDVEVFNNEFQEFQDIEIDLGIQKIEFDPDKGPDSTPGEDQILIPLLKEPK